MRPERDEVEASGEESGEEHRGGRQLDEVVVQVPARGQDRHHLSE